MEVIGKASSWPKGGWFAATAPLNGKRDHQTGGYLPPHARLNILKLAGHISYYYPPPQLNIITLFCYFAIQLAFTEDI